MNTAQAVQEKPEAKSNKVYKIALTGLFAALSYVVFTFLQFKIYLPGGDATSIHLGNAVCVLGALCKVHQLPMDYHSHHILAR